jgi:hypothetical protein
MGDNALEVLRIADKEDVISNLLAYCIRQSESFRNVFLVRICGLEPAAYPECEVHSRPQVPKVGTPDLVVVCKGQATDWVIIENKLNALEGKDQTKHYASRETVDALSERFGLDSPAIQPKFVFLTLFPDQVPTSDQFSCVRYSSLLHDRVSLNKGSALARQLSSAWLDVLEHFYASEHLHADEQVAQKHSDAHVPGADYLAFRTLIRSISLPPEVELDRLFRQSQKGRRYYGAAVTKPRWKTEPFDDSGRLWTLPKDNRHIHIEPQYNVLDQTLKVHIHYETNTYHPVKKLQERVPQDQYEIYTSRRNAFAQHLDGADIAPFRLSVHSNQLAIAEVSLLDATVADAQEQMQTHIEDATRAVDRALGAEAAA